MNSGNSDNSFRSILKGTSIFGSVQVFNIVVAAVRLKFVALILGPAGMGVAGLFNSISLTIQQFASLGLNLAVVKEVGAAKEDSDRLKSIVSAALPVAMMLALAGSLVCLVFPGLLSGMTFGNQHYRTAFMILSASVFFSIVGAALMSVLQGLREVRRLSGASVVGSLVGLIVGVPMYWFWGTGGIVPAMVALSAATCGWYLISLKKSLTFHPEAWNRDIHLPIARKILGMGLILMSNELFKSVAAYLINVYVRSAGGEVEVGFYQSCSTMTSQYSAIVFTAMTMEYLPRLASAAKDNSGMCDVVNRQLEVVGYMVAPMVCAVILLAPLVIELLQTSEFIVAAPLLRLLALAVAVRAVMYPLGYIVFAKDNRRLFFWMESVGANLLTLLLTCGCYSLFGLNGLGIAAIADCGICVAVYLIVNRILYGYRLSRKAVLTSSGLMASSSAMAVISFLLEGPVMYLSGAMLLLLTIFFAAANLKRLWSR